MTSFSKYLNFFLAGIAAVFAFLYYTHSCPVCPQIVRTTSIQIDTLVIHDTIRSEKIRLVKIVSPPDSWVNNVQNCDSVNELFNSEYFSTLDISDSLMSGVVNETISQNQITAFTMEKKYLLPVKTDSVIQVVNVPSYKNCFTVGLFAGKSSGINIGYRFAAKHLSAGYDVINKGVVFGFNMDIK